MGENARADAAKTSAGEEHHQRIDMGVEDRHHHVRTERNTDVMNEKPTAPNGNSEN